MINGIPSSLTIDGICYIEITNEAAEGVRENTYYISEFGNVYSTLSNKFMKCTLAKNGYYIINLKQISGNSKVFYLHRLLMIVFRYIPNHRDMQVNHIDGNKLNCSLNNMEWVTLQGNNKHAKETGLLCVGEDCPWSSLTNEQVHEICRRIQDREYTTFTDLARDFNCTLAVIVNIASGKEWKQISKDYNLNYSPQNKFTEQQVHFICNVFAQNKEKSFEYLYYLIIFYLGLPEDSHLRRRIYKLYHKDPSNYAYITSQYDY